MMAQTEKRFPLIPSGPNPLGDHSKREKRRQHVSDALDQPNEPDVELHRCHCGAPIQYEVNRKSGVALVCPEHVPTGCSLHCCLKFGTGWLS